MNRKLALASTGLQALRQSPLHSLLSILGLVIGVAALVAILSLVDGMEVFARQQIESRTGVQSITVVPSQTERIDNVTVRRDSIPVLTLEDSRALRAELGEEVRVALAQRRPVELAYDTSGTAAVVVASEASIWYLPSPELEAGRLFSEADVSESGSVVVINGPLAHRLAGERASSSLLGDTIWIGATPLEIIGVLDGEDDDGAPIALGPYNMLAEDLESYPPALAIHADVAEDVVLHTESLKSWLDVRFGERAEAFDIATNEEMNRELRQGMLMFKLIMGLITGISVLVGGVGVMNVLLMAVTERTAEIGVRKATGATRRDIVFQFLSEAVVVSAAGSLLGLLLGLAGVFSIVPIIRSVAEMPFNAAFTWGTLAVVGVLAVFVGVVFGTYPAYRAARLSPVEAIRHE